MAPFDQNSALQGFDSENVDSLRRLMNGIMHRLAGVPASTVAKLDDLEFSEHGTMIYLTENARRNDLLTRIITRFAFGRYGNSRTVREAAREMDLVIIEAVLNPDRRPQREFAVAEGFFNQLVANGAAEYGAGGENEYGDIAPDTDEEDNNDNDKKGKNLRTLRKRTRSSNAAPASNKRSRMGVSWADDAAVDDQESIPDYLDAYDDDDFGEDVKTPLGKSSDPAMQKHVAKRKHGERCLPDPTISRDNALVGHPDSSKTSFILQTERPDPKNPGSFSPSDPVHFVYAKEVDWNNKESVNKLNSWRYQVFKRTWGQKRDSRPPWTINEKDKLLEMISSHLSSPATGGRYSQINWADIEKNFNQFFQIHVHRKGEMTAETSYNQRGKDYTAKSRALVADRLHLPRSAGAIENQLTHFTDSLARTLVASARQADQNATAGNTPMSKGKSKARTPATTSTTKRKTRARKIKKEESDEDDVGFEDNDDQDHEDFQDSIIMNKRAVKRKDIDRKSGVESYRRHW